MTNMQSNMNQFERPDPVLTSKIVTQLKSQGIFDQFRKECMADVDTKPAYHNLRQRVESSVSAFLRKNPWKPEMNKNQMREQLRRHIQSGGFLDAGVDRIVDQVVNPKIYSVFLPKVEEVVQSCLEMDEDSKPKFVAPAKVEVTPAPISFQQRFNLAPRARLSASLMDDPTTPKEEMVECKEEEKETDEKEEITRPKSPIQLQNTNETHPTDEKEPEENAEEDDDDDEEESPPFEPHSENDRMILGVRSDESDNSDVFVERIDVHSALENEESDEKEDSIEKEDCETDENDDQEEETREQEKDNEQKRDIKTKNRLKKENGDTTENHLTKQNFNKEYTDKADSSDEDESSSNEYVPKTPTIIESSDDAGNEFDSISVYKKFDEENFGNVEEEVISSQWMDDSNSQIKEEKISNKKEFVHSSRKRKIYSESFDETSNSSVGKESSSDESKHTIFSSEGGKRIKLKEVNSESEAVSCPDNEDSSVSVPEAMDNSDVTNYQEKQKNRSISSPKSSEKRHHHHHKDKEHRKDRKESSSSNSSKSKDKDHRAGVPSHSSRDRKSDKYESSGDRNKERERKKSESSLSKHSHSHKSKHHGKNKEKDEEKKKSEKHKSDKNEKDVVKDSEDSKHEHNERRSRDNQDKEKEQRDSHEKLSEGKLDSTHKDKKGSSKSSKHSHSSSKHSHRSSSEKHKSHRDQKHKHSSEKQKTPDKISDKDSKQEHRKKHREQCKTNDIEHSRRSSDRDSNGPSSKSYEYNSSKNSSSRSHTQSSSVENGEKTSSNSDNVVSHGVDVFNDNLCKTDLFSSEIPKSVVQSDGSCLDINVSKETFNDRNKCAISMEAFNAGMSECGQTENDLESNNTKSFTNEETSEVQINQSTSAEPNHNSKEKNNIDVNVKNNTTENLSEVNFMASAQSHSLHSGLVQHDTSSEKENIEAENLEESTNNKISNGLKTVAMKFKKPKIAANIFEVKKIMQARKHLQRIEKKRTKLLAKKPKEKSEDEESNSVPLVENEKISEEKNKFITIEPSKTRSLPKNATDNITEDEGFKGFEIVCSEKVELYDQLIKKLDNEITNINNVHENSSIVTSWIDLSPELDDFIVNDLKGKVHRKLRIRVPVISEEHYRFSHEHNAYELLDAGEESSSPQEKKVDSNLNNVNPVFKSQENDDETSHEKLKATFNGSSLVSTCDSTKISPKTLQVKERKSSLAERVNSIKSKVTSPPRVRKHSTDEPENNQGPTEVSSESKPKCKSNSMCLEVGGPKVMFSLTFNQTYDEVLKEKEVKSIESSKSELELPKVPQTVVKITSSCKDSNEQVVVKAVLPNVQKKSQVPRITKSEHKVNGKIPKPLVQQKQMPLISRINKKQNVLTPTSASVKISRLNGKLSQDNASPKEDFSQKQIDPEIVNSVIGVRKASTKQGQIKEHTTPPKEQRLTRESRQAGPKSVKRYDDSDLYKPRPQLSGRRSRGLATSLTESLVPPNARKRLATSTETIPVKKRR